MNLLNNPQAANAGKRISPSAFSLKSAAVQQGFIVVLASMILDGGRLLEMCLFGIVGFWAATFLLLRRKSLPTKADLLFMQGGSLPLCVLSYFVAGWVWHLRGL